MASEQPIPKTRDELEAWMAREGITGEDAQATRIDWQEQQFQEGQAAAQEQYPGTKEKLGGVMSTVMNFGEGVIPGVASTVGALASAPITGAGQPTSYLEEVELNKRRAQAILGANPTAATVGRVAAAVAPNTPANRMLSWGFRSLGGARLARAAAVEPSLAKSAAQQLASAVVGGGGGIATLNAVEGAQDVALTDKSIGDVASETAGQILSPTNLGLSVALGGVPSLARVAADPHTKELVEQAKRLIPNFKPSPDMLRPGGWIASLVDSLSKSDAGRNAVAKWMESNAYEPMRGYLGELRSKFGVETDVAAQRAERMGAEATRSLLPTVEDIGGLARGRQKQSAKISAAPQQLGPGPLRPIVSTIDRLDEGAARGRWSDGPNSSEFGGIKKEIRDVLAHVDEQVDMPSHWRAESGDKGFRRTGEQVPVQVLENFRVRLGEIANFEGSGAGGQRGMAANISPRDVREAKMLYRVIRETERKLSPDIDTALKEIHEIRTAEKGLRQVANTANLGTDMELAKQIFTAPNFNRRWTALENQLPRDRVEALKGAYLGKFLETVEIERGLATQKNLMLNGGQMRHLLKGHGDKQFQQEIFDRVLSPQIREQLMEQGAVSDMVRRTVGTAEGSHTAGRTDQTNLLNAGMNVTGSVAGILKEPGAMNAALSTVLGFAGRLGLAETLLNGRLAGFLNNMATGVPLEANKLASGVLMEGGGAGNVGQEALGLGVQGLQAGMQGARAIGNIGERREEQ